MVLSPSQDTTVTTRSVTIAGTVRPDLQVWHEVNGAHHPEPASLDTVGSYAVFTLQADKLVTGENIILVRAISGVEVVDSAKIVVTVDALVLHYSVTYLGTLGGDDSHATDLNDAGQIVGYSQDASGATFAFLWQDGTMTRIGVGLGTESNAAAINEDGQIVGTYDRGGASTAAFLWENGRVTDSLVSSTADYVRAIDVTEDGHVLVETSYPNLGLIWHQGSTSTIGAPLNNDAWDQLVAINSQRAVVGLTHCPTEESFTCVYPETAVLWRDGTFRDVAVPGVPTDINNHGLVTFYTRGGHGTVAFAGLWSDGNRTVLEAPVSSRAISVNDQGQVLGRYPENLGSKQFLWENHVITDIVLTDPIWILDAIGDLNDLGQFIAHGTNEQTGETGALLLTPNR